MPCSTESRYTTHWVLHEPAVLHWKGNNSISVINTFTILLCRPTLSFSTLHPLPIPKWSKLMQTDSLRHREISPIHQASILYWDSKGNSVYNLGGKWGQIFGCQLSFARYKGLFTAENSSVKCSHHLRFKSSGYSYRLSGMFLFVWVFCLLACFFVWLFLISIPILCPLATQGSVVRRLQRKKKAFAIVFTC